MLSVTTELSPGHAWDTGVPTRVEVEAAKGARAAWRRGSVKCRMGACSTNKVIFDSVFGNLALSPQRHLPIHAPKDLGMGDYWRRGLGTKKACWPCLLGETPSHPEVMCTNSIAPDRGSATRNWPAWDCFMPRSMHCTALRSLLDAPLAVWKIPCSRRGMAQRPRGELCGPDFPAAQLFNLAGASRTSKV